MGTEQNRRKRRVSSLLLAFVLCLCFTAMVFTSQISLGLCSNKNVIEAKNKSQYVGDAYKAFRQKYESILEQNSLPIDLTEKAFEENKFYGDSGSSAKNSLKNGNGEVHVVIEKKLLAEEISQYLTKGKNNLKETELKAIDEVTSEVASYYEKYTTFKFGQVFYQYRLELIEGMKLYLPGLLAITVGAIVLLWAINRKRGRTIDYVVMSIVGAMLSSLSIYYLTDFRKTILPQGGEEYYRNFILELLDFTFPPLAFSLALGMVISVILILVRRHGR